MVMFFSYGKIQGFGDEILRYFINLYSVYMKILPYMVTFVLEFRNKTCSQYLNSLVKNKANM